MWPHCSAAVPTFDGETRSARAISRSSSRDTDDARRCHDALARGGYPGVYTGDTDVFTVGGGRATGCALLEAFDQTAPQRSGACGGGDGVLRDDRGEPARPAVTH